MFTPLDINRAVNSLLIANKTSGLHLQNFVLKSVIREQLCFDELSVNGKSINVFCGSIDKIARDICKDLIIEHGLIAHLPVANNHWRLTDSESGQAREADLEYAILDEQGLFDKLSFLDDDLIDIVMEVSAWLKVPIQMVNKVAVIHHAVEKILTNIAIEIFRHDIKLDRKRDAGRIDSAK